MRDAVLREATSTTSLNITVDTRPGAIFRRVLLDILPGIAGWAFGYSMLLVVVTVLYPELEQTGALLNVLNGLGLLDAFTNATTADVTAVTTFPGYLGVQALGWAPTLLSVFLIPQTINAIMGEEQRGTLDILLSTPIPRWRLLLEKVAAVVVALALILLVMFATLSIAINVVPDVDMTVAQAAAGMWHVFPITCCIIGVTLLLSVTLRSTRTVGGLASLFVIGNLFFRTIADIGGTDFLNQVRKLSLYDYYSAVDAMVNRIPWQTDLLLLASALVLFAASVWQFNRRDIGV